VCVCVCACLLLTKELPLHCSGTFTLAVGKQGDVEKVRSHLSRQASLSSLFTASMYVHSTLLLNIANDISGSNSSVSSIVTATNSEIGRVTIGVTKVTMIGLLGKKGVQGQLHVCVVDRTLTSVYSGRQQLFNYRRRKSFVLSFAVIRSSSLLYIFAPYGFHIS